MLKPSKFDLNQLILIDKPVGLSSFGVVARIRRVLSEYNGKKVKVGHAGTLDPFASGLMLVLTGNRTKDANQLLKFDKTYLTTIILGWETNTFDTEGTLSRYARYQPSIKLIHATIEQFIGVINQTPPAFSAIKINGKRAYDLARRGQVFEIPSRQVNVSSIEVINYNYPKLTLRMDVSSGTYVRSLARDIGRALGTGSYCSSLRRETIGDYQIKTAQRLADFSITS